MWKKMSIKRYKQGSEEKNSLFYIAENGVFQPFFANINTVVHMFSTSCGQWILQIRKCGQLSEYNILQKNIFFYNMLNCPETP